MAYPIESTYLKKTYQLLSKLDPVDFSLEEAFDRASNIIYLWAVKDKKLYRIFPEIPDQKQSFDVRREGYEFGVLYEPDNYRFILRLSHPDLSVNRRFWITDVQLFLNDSGDCFILAVRVAASSPISCKEPVGCNCPSFIKKLICNIGITDCIKITDKPQILDTAEKVDSFVSLLENDDRRFPVFLLTPCFDWVSAPYSGYMLDAEQLASDLAGTAHIFTITQEINDYLNDKLGKIWTAFNGAVRTYYPGLSFEESDCYKHPLVTQNKFYLQKEEGTDFSDLGSDIEDHIKSFVSMQRIFWENNNVDFYLQARSNMLIAQRELGEQSRQEMVDSFEEQVQKLKSQLKEVTLISDADAGEVSTCREIIDEQAKTISDLKNYISVLKDRITKSSGTPNIEDIPLNGTYSEIETWIRTYCPDRLFLTSRAKRSLKDAQYENVELVYQCLYLLATDYYDYQIGVIDRPTFEERCREIDPGLCESKAMTDIAAGEFEEQYYIIYQGKKHKIDRHLKKGVGHDEKHCLRIYFFWDDETQSTVLCGLPYHLDTRNS